MDNSCSIEFKCSELTDAICIDGYEYKCSYYIENSEFPSYCIHDPDRTGNCECFEVKRFAMSRHLKLHYGLGTVRWNNVQLKPIDYGEEGWNNKG